MSSWLKALSGYRTYLTAFASILFIVSTAASGIATTLGGLDLTSGTTLTITLGSVASFCGSLAIIFQRLGAANETNSLLEEIEKLRKLLHPDTDPVDPFANLTLRDQVPTGTAHPGMILLCFLGISSAAFASPPVAIITGPHTAEPGEEVILDASKCEGGPTLFAWRVFPKLEGRKQLTILDGGKQCRLSSFPGKYIVRLMISNGEAIADQEFLITIPGNAPCPPAPDPTPLPPTPLPPNPTPNPPTPTPVPVPTPTPVPPPEPVLPAGEFDGLPNAIKVLALTVVSPTRAAEAGRLADAFEALAAQLAAGTLKTPVQIVAAVGTAFNTASTPAWDAAFRAAAVAKMKSLYDAGKLSTPEKWRAMLLEAALGLRAVK